MPDIWPLYLSTGLQWAVDRMPPSRFLGLLFSESTQQVHVVHCMATGVAFVELQIGGECHDLPTSVRYKLYKKDLGHQDKLKIVNLVKLFYHHKRDPQQTTVKSVARALGVTL